MRFRGGLVFEAHRLCVSLNSRLEVDKEEDLVVVVGQVGLDARWREVEEHLVWGLGFRV